MEEVFYVISIGCFLMFYSGIIKRQLLLVKKAVKFNTWHVVFCVTTIPMSFFLMRLLIGESTSSVYTVWIPPLMFHLSNMGDLKQQLRGRKV